MAIPGQDVAATATVDTTLHASMLAEEPLKSFWEFATTVRRTKSLADRESARLRGTWLAPGLAVQRVHGWGLRSVRLLCVKATSEEHGERLRLFFQRDRRNLEGHMKNFSDPLNNESRVLVKIPYDAGPDTWVTHERQVLTELSGIDGVPRLGPLLYFDDIKTHAATYEYCDAPSVQDFLEQGRLMPQEQTHSVLTLMLLALARAHSLGWLHTDICAKDVLVSQQDHLDQAHVRHLEQEHLRRNVMPDASGIGQDSHVVQVSRRCGSGIICGWSRAVRCSQAIMPSPSIIEFANALPVRSPNAVNCADTGIGTTTEDGDATSRPDASAPSIYSAPEQFLALFAGITCIGPATDIYRAAGITIMATCGNAPLGIQGKPVASAVAPDIDTLRRLCKQAILRRSEEAGKVSLPAAEEVQSFAACLERLVNGRANLRGCREAGELVPWFEQALAREVGMRFQTADEAMEALDAAWSKYEGRLAWDYRQKQMEIERAPPPKEVEKRQRIVFERPPELDEMTVV